jgi:hypothetical protein
MKMTDRDWNLIAGFNEYQFMELKDKIDQIKNILKLNIYNYPHDKSFNTSYYVTVSGNHRIVIIHDDFTHIASYNQKQKNDAYDKITQLDFKFIFKNEDILKLKIDDFNSVEKFLGDEKFINNFNDLNGPLGHKAVLVIYEKM